MSKRHDSEFEKFLREHVSIDAKGLVQTHDAYAYLGFTIMWGGSPVSVTYANLVWFLTHDRWPKDGFHIDHINDDSLDNRPENLQEITETENQAKRRGRKVYRNYGTGKYGYGINVCLDKRDGRYYVRRHLSRGHGEGDLRTIRKNLGGFDTLAEAELKVKGYIEEINANGLDYVPDSPSPREKKATVALEAVTEKLRELRMAGHTIEQIAEMTGFSSGSVFKRVRDLGIDKRLKR